MLNRKNIKTSIVIKLVSAIAISWLIAQVTYGQSENYLATKTAEGNSDLNGIWQALGSAHFDIEGHAARPSPIVTTGALGAVPAGLSVVIGGEIPYKNWARKQQQENLKHAIDLDPAVKCYMPGIPRATYMPFPFQIVQTSDHILIAYEFASASRIIYMDRPDFEAPVDAWMGHSTGRWEGDTLIVSVTSQVADTWFDRSGNFHTNAMLVEERYTPISPNHLIYEATIEDPDVYTKPWTLRLPLYRRLEQNMQLLEFKCVEFVEELLYGHLRKDSE